MIAITLTEQQTSLAEAPLQARIFLSGPAGAGKTTVGVARLDFLLHGSVRGDQILILAPQRSLCQPYAALLESPERPPGSEPTVATIGGLARRMCQLFWPLAAESAGFSRWDRPPTFLTLETAQYYMAHLVRPLLDQGYFEAVSLDRNRLYSQILDNLNKSALVGFPYTEIGPRLDAAFRGEPAQRRVLSEVQDCASRFRAFCLSHNLLDFSLQLEVFLGHLWTHPTVRGHLAAAYRHLIYDNLEEDVPRAHDLVRQWGPDFESMLLINDEGGGFRRFLGADTGSGQQLETLCQATSRLESSFVMSERVVALERTIVSGLSGSLTDLSRRTPTQPGSSMATDGTLSVLAAHFYPGLLDEVARTIQGLVRDEGVPPDEIVVLGSYLSDTLRFSLASRLDELGVAWRSLRPSRSLREEPASRALITLAAIAHPAWGISPPKFDVAYALLETLQGLDLVRAQLLAEIVYRPRELQLTSFGAIKPEVQERITYAHGARYEALREWLLDYRQKPPLPLDHFLRRLFGEVVSQPGFRFHSSPDAVRVISSLVESVFKFRLAMEPAELGKDGSDTDVGRVYVEMLLDGVIAASYPTTGPEQSDGAVLLAPAHAFLMLNRVATTQFWLDVGSNGWHQRPAQPLTHPYVLSRNWESGRLWTDSDELQADEETLQRLVSGLLHRCRQRVFVGISEYGENGYEQRGPFLHVIQDLLAGK